MFDHHDISRDACMLRGALRRKGYDWWWHSFTAVDVQTGQEKAFFIEFFLCNPDLAEEEPVLGQLPENKAAGKKPSYLMVKAGCWGEDHCQLHRFFPWRKVSLHADAPYRIAAEDCLASETRLRGSVRITEEEALAHPEWMCGSGEIRWDLKVHKKTAFNVGYGASRLFRTLNAFAMYWHAEGMKTLYRGTIVCNGRTYTVRPETCGGYADKNWGSDFTTPWVWIASSRLKSRRTGRELKNSVFDIGGGRPKIFGVALDRRLLGVFYYEGREYDFNFSHFWLGVRTKFSFEEKEEEVVWHIRQTNLFSAMDTEIRCLKKDMLFVNYESPDGAKRHNRLWNGGNGRGTVRLYDRKGWKMVPRDIIDVTHAGCEYGEYDK